MAAVFFNLLYLQAFEIYFPWLYLQTPETICMLSK